MKSKCVLIHNFYSSLRIKIKLHRETEILEELSSHLNILHFLTFFALTKNGSRHDLTVGAIFRSPSLDVLQMAFHECLNARWKACYGGCQRGPQFRRCLKSWVCTINGNTLPHLKILNDKKWHDRSDVWFSEWEFLFFLEAPHYYFIDGQYILFPTVPGLLKYPLAIMYQSSMIYLTSWCPRVKYPFADEHIDGLSLSQVRNCWTSLVSQW